MAAGIRLPAWHAPFRGVGSQLRTEARWVRKMRTEPWHPTHAQEEAALALADSDVGARVRSHSDGTVEVRTVEKGAFRRYVIQRDGAAALIESGPPTWRYAWSKRFCWLGLLLVLAAFLTVAKIDDFWGAMMIFAGILIFVVGLAVMPYGKEPSGERWVSIGGPQE